MIKGLNYRVVVCLTLLVAISACGGGGGSDETSENFENEKFPPNLDSINGVPSIKRIVHESDPVVFYDNSLSLSKSGNLLSFWQRESGDYQWELYDTRANANITNTVNVEFQQDCTFPLADAALSEDSHVIVSWICPRDDSSNPKVYFRVFDTLGKPITEEILVSDDYSNSREAPPKIIFESADEFRIIWFNMGWADINNNILYYLRCERYNLEGNNLNDSGFLSSKNIPLYSPKIVSKFHDDYFVLAESRDIENYGIHLGNYYRQMLSNNFIRVDSTEIIEGDNSPLWKSYDIDLNRNMVAVAWIELQDQLDRDSKKIKIKYFDALGAPTTNEIVIDRPAGNHIEVMVNNSNTVFVIWQNKYYSLEGILLDESGSPISEIKSLSNYNGAPAASIGSDKFYLGMKSYNSADYSDKNHYLSLYELSAAQIKKLPDAKTYSWN